MNTAWKYLAQLLRMKPEKLQLADRLLIDTFEVELLAEYGNVPLPRAVRMSRISDQFNSQ